MTWSDITKGLIFWLVIFLIADMLMSEAQAQTRRVIRESCVGNRCVLYERGSRIGTITRDIGRYVVRDQRGRITARVRTQRGALRVEEARRGR